MKLIHIGAVSAIGVGVLGGCAHDENAVSSTTTTSAVTVLNDTAVENIVYGRCTHENACNNVGEGREWESLAACTTSERGTVNQTISRDTCPRGIDAYALQNCMSAIDRSPCTMSGLPNECLKAKLCL